jgi:predicted ATPase
LLAELGTRGYHTFEEPGRRVVKEQLARGGDGLPWLDVQRFAQLCIARGLAQLAEASTLEGHAFFDRSIIDAVSALEHLRLPVPREARDALASRPYSARVFMAPPWPELFATDAERRHTFADAEAEFERLLRDYPRFGYELVQIPKRALASRANFVLDALAR